MATAEARVEHLTSLVRGCVQHVGIVRYDAFEDVAGIRAFRWPCLMDVTQALLSQSFIAAQKSAYTPNIWSQASRLALAPKRSPLSIRRRQAPEARYAIMGFSRT